MRRLFAFGPYHTSQDVEKYLGNIIEDRKDFLEAMNAYFLMYKTHKLVSWQIIQEQKYPSITQFIIFAEFDLESYYEEKP